MLLKMRLKSQQWYDVVDGLDSRNCQRRIQRSVLKELQASNENIHREVYDGMNEEGIESISKLAIEHSIRNLAQKP